MELMVALAVTSVALLTMIGVFTGGLRLLHQSQAVTVATETGRSELETIKDLGWAGLPSADAEWDSRAGDPAVAGFPPPPYPSTPMLVTVEEIQSGMKSVTVRVYYEGNTAVTMETYLVEPPAP